MQGVQLSVGVEDTVTWKWDASGCSFSMQVWHSVSVMLNLHNAVPAREVQLLDWWLDQRKSIRVAKRKGLDSAFMLVSWKLWKERNDRVFVRSSPKNAVQLLAEITQEGQLCPRSKTIDSVSGASTFTMFITQTFFSRSAAANGMEEREPCLIVVHREVLRLRLAVHPGPRGVEPVRRRAHPPRPLDGPRAPRSDGPVGTRCMHELRLRRMYHAASAAASSLHIGGCCRLLAS
uniref:Uncharacterized protein n=1 Tax=Setaria viridis TaxID=4556 RepID=A0A4U6V4W2_SETVI|nr:hypothetical protein SEVIR_4G289700v2 [Setaria viridis]